MKWLYDREGLEGRMYSIQDQGGMQEKPLDLHLGLKMSD
jgi:hypothetical protein